MTTDITELAPAMKAAAEKASPGDWVKESGDGWDAICSNDDQANSGFIIAHFVGPDSASNREFMQLANPANLLALVEALEKAQQEAEELSKFKEVMTSAAEALKVGSPLNLESLFKGELASAMFSMMFAGEFVRSGATNYLELLYDVPEFGEMTVTLQKVEGKTPGQRIDDLVGDVEKLKQESTAWEKVAEKQIATAIALESRTVKLLDCDLAAVQHMSGGSMDYCNGFVDGTQNAIRAMRSAGVDVKEAE